MNRPRPALALLSTVVVAGMFVALPHGEITRGGYLFMAATVAALVATTWYSVWTGVHLARDSKAGSRVSAAGWGLALLALVLNLWLCFMVLGTAVLILIGRPIVALVVVPGITA